MLNNVVAPFPKYLSLILVAYNQKKKINSYLKNRYTG